MSTCIFIASDHPLPEVKPSHDYSTVINIDKGTISDGGADDNFYLSNFREAELYTKLRYAVSLQWHYTNGRAQEILKYIKKALEYTEVVELWHVWLLDYYEFEDRPFVHRKTITIAQLKSDDIKEIDEAEIWNKPDRHYPDRPSFYCLKIVR